VNSSTKKVGKQRLLIGSINPIITKPGSDMLASLTTPINRNNASKDRNGNENASSQATPYKNKSVPLNLSINQ